MPQDLPKVMREKAEAELITGLAAALPAPDSPEGQAATFLLSNMSLRMAGTLRDEVETRGRIKAKEAEAVLSAVVAAVRSLMELGEITLIENDDEEA